MELLHIEVPEAYVGTVIEATGRRKGELLNMVPGPGETVKLEIRIPSRGLIGYRPEFLTDTRGTGVMYHVFDGYDTYRGEIPGRNRVPWWHPKPALPWPMGCTMPRNGAASL